MMPRYGRGYYSSRDIGHERARQHIEDYRRLEAELGGSLEDVKQYFFALNPAQLQKILGLYGQQYGVSARQYAERIIRKWQTNRVHMSGQTATRLFKLLPSHMPLESKYRLIENLWNHVGTTTRKALRIGLDATTEQVTQAVREHLDDVVVPHRIPAAFEGRFNWLAAGDAQLKQDLLNHMRQHMEKALVAEAARLQLPIMQDHLRSNAGQQTYRLAQILKLGNHELELLIDKNASGVAIVEPFVQSTISRAASAAAGQKSNLSWVWWAIAAAVALYFFVGPKTPKTSYQPSTSTPTYQPSTRPTNQPSTMPPPTTRAEPLQPSPRPATTAAPPPPGASADGLADHGPGRVTCDVQWSQSHMPESNYQNFIRDCMRRYPERR
jgi:hypothetical protein